MKKSQFLGTLFPSHPDLQPIIQQLREKYNLREVFPDEEPITEIYLGDQILWKTSIKRSIFVENFLISCRLKRQNCY